MRKLVTLNLFILVFTVCNFQIYAKDSDLILEKGVEAHKDIDGIYKQFILAYKTLNAELIADLYADNAAYLVPNENIAIGRKNILLPFSDFFKQAKDSNESIKISFRIFQRKINPKMAYDVGIFTVSILRKEKKVGQMRGKFIVVTLKGKDNKWRFQVDGYSQLKPANKTSRTN